MTFASKNFRELKTMVLLKNKSAKKTNLIEITV